MKKTFVVDTNVLLYDPDALFKFPRHHVVIPLSVIEKLDKMKHLPNELGKNARTIFQALDRLGKSGQGAFDTGILLDNSSTLRIYSPSLSKIKGEINVGLKEHQIILTAYSLQEAGERVVFVSKDFAARVRAEAVNLPAEDYENLKYSYDNLYRGISFRDVEKSVIDHFLKDGKVSLDNIDGHPNEFISLVSKDGAHAVGSVSKDHSGIESLKPLPDLWGVKPRNIQQRCAIDALLRDDIKLVTLMGPAGTGKTLLALACGIRKVFDEQRFNRILISRPIIPLGRDIGYLPGTKEEKLFHWMQPIYDNLEYLCGSSHGDHSKDTVNWVMESQKIEMEAVAYIRGRSLPNVYIIVDEAQNLTPHEMKTIISRAGEGTKVVLTGDPEQIDNPYLDRDSNGLTYVVGRFAQSHLFAHIFLSKTERSELAGIAADIL